ALGLAIPLVVSLATERAARSGVLVTDRLALEGMRTVDTVLFDKTGTLTRGEPALSEIAVAESARIDEQALLGLAAAAESESEHPLAGAIRDRAAADGAAVPTASEITSAPALGVSARVDGHEIRVGGPRLLEETGAAEHEEAPAWREEGAIVLHVLRDGESIGALKLADAVREESREAIDALHERDIQVVMITGDAQNVAEHVGAELGIDRIFAGVRPEDKADRVAELQGECRRVAMDGDGVNDARALARADVGLAIGAGTDVPIGSGGVVLASSDPLSVLWLRELARAADGERRQSRGWAAGSNRSGARVAAVVLAPRGFGVRMGVGALLLGASSVGVVLNAQVLRARILRAEAIAPRR